MSKHSLKRMLFWFRIRSELQSFPVSKRFAIIWIPSGYVLAQNTMISLSLELGIYNIVDFTVSPLSNFIRKLYACILLEGKWYKLKVTKTHTVAVKDTSQKVYFYLIDYWFEKEAVFENI